MLLPLPQGWQQDTVMEDRISRKLCTMGRKNVDRLGKPHKKLVIRINAPLSRQPLVKGERLVRSEVSAAMKLDV